MPFTKRKRAISLSWLKRQINLMVKSYGMNYGEVDFYYRWYKERGGKLSLKKILQEK